MSYCFWSYWYLKYQAKNKFFISDRTYKMYLESNILSKKSIIQKQKCIKIKLKKNEINVKHVVFNWRIVLLFVFEGII